jgi:hypothetical protein
MALTRMGTFTFLHASQVDALYTVYTATQIKGFFDSQATELKTYANSTLCAELESPAIVTVTGDKTLALTDILTVQKVNLGTAITITIPTNSVVAFPIGATIAFLRYGAGTVTFAGAGVTINAANAYRSINNQYGTACLEKLATDEWALFGSLTT